MKLLNDLKEAGQDYEWYPTTDEIISAVKDDIKRYMTNHRMYSKSLSVLDCGAGDGRVLMQLTDGNRYAIEKSTMLISHMPKEIIIVGTDFHHQTLLDKQPDVIFCNPPYLEFSTWMCKIITESNCGIIYMVVPSRWADDGAIAEAIKSRGATTEVILSTDFLDADRAARATVDVIRITGRYDNRLSVSDPFDIWFKKNFVFKEEENKEEDKQEMPEPKKQNQMVDGYLIYALSDLYERDLQHLLDQFMRVSSLDADLLKAIGVSIDNVKQCLEMQIKGLKVKYWKELLNSLDSITTRLCVKPRNNILDKISKNMNVDFTKDNIREIVLWVIKNANSYIDEQLIEFSENLSDRANVALYKSNEYVFKDENWRYTRDKNLDRFKLEYRVVVSRYYNCWNTYGAKQLADNASGFIDDMMVVAYNLGFDTSSTPRSNMMNWKAGKSNLIMYKNSDGNDEVLADVKIYMNNNIHVKFNKAFMCKLNVEFGRLKGWIKDWKDASAEMDIPEKSAMSYFNSNTQIDNNLLLN